MCLPNIELHTYAKVSVLLTLVKSTVLRINFFIFNSLNIDYSNIVIKKQIQTLKTSFDISLKIIKP